MGWGRAIIVLIMWMVVLLSVGVFGVMSYIYVYYLYLFGGRFSYNIFILRDINSKKVGNNGVGLCYIISNNVDGCFIFHRDFWGDVL